MSNIFAYTEFEYKSYPGYVSLNKVNDKYILTIRDKEGKNQAEVEVPFLELLKMAGNINGLVSFEGNDDE